MTPEVRIVPAGVADAGLLLALEEVLFPEDPWTEGMIREELASPHSAYLLALAPGDEGETAVLGYAGVKCVADAADVMTIGVLSDARRLGLGRALLDALVDLARSRGARCVFLEVRESNAAARALYASAGFTEIGRIRRYFRNPEEDAVGMRLDLAGGADERAPRPAEN